MSVSSFDSPSSRSEPHSSTAFLPWWGRIETVWLVLPVICALIYALCQELAPNDLWYHVRAGEFIERLGHVPTQNGMSTGVPLSTPYYYQSWLAEFFLYQTLKWTGLAGLQVMRALCLSVAWGCISGTIFRALQREAGISSLVAARVAALVAVWGFVISSNNVDLRPQTFSVLLFGCWLASLSEFFGAKRPSRYRLWGGVLVALALLWANTHGAFVISLISLAALTWGYFITGRRNEALRGLGVLTMCVIATCVNPQGMRIYPYLLELSSQPIGQKYIQEWQSPGFNEWHNILFFLSMPLALGAMSLGWQRNRQLLPWSWVVGAIWIMGLRDMRSIIWFALCCPMLLAPGLAIVMTGKKPHLSPGAPDSSSQKASASVPALLNAVVLVFLFLLPLGLLPAVKAQWPWPPEFRARFAPTPQRLFPKAPPLLLERSTPVETVEFLMSHPPQRKIFTDMVLGSYMTWASHPQILPWCDPRIELFPDAFWEDYFRLINGPTTAAAELERRGFSDALLDTELDAPLVRRLETSKRWKVVARGGKSILFRYL